MIVDLQEVVLEFETLTAVFCHFADDLNEPDSLQFQFEHGGLRISAVAEDDSVLVSLPLGSEGFSAISERNPWKSLIGGKVTGAWILRNNYDYEDGVELEIVGVAGEDFLLRLVVIASTIHASLMRPNLVNWL